MTKEISIDEVKKLAKLSQISISDSEAKQLATEMSGILGYVEQLNHVDTEGLETTSQVTGLKNANRSDEVTDTGVTRKELLDSAPEQAANQIKTKRIIQ